MWGFSRLVTFLRNARIYILKQRQVVFKATQQCDFKTFFFTKKNWRLFTLNFMYYEGGTLFFVKKTRISKTHLIGRVSLA